MAKQLLGKEVTAAMNQRLQERVAALKEKGISPKLAIIRCGENPSDLAYEKGAESRAALIGVEVQKFLLPGDVSKGRLIETIDQGQRRWFHPRLSPVSSPAPPFKGGAR